MILPGNKAQINPFYEAALTKGKQTEKHQFKIQPLKFTFCNNKDLNPSRNKYLGFVSILEDLRSREDNCFTCNI